MRLTTGSVRKRTGTSSLLDSQPVGVLYGFVLSDGRRVPDPASRFQPLGAEGPTLPCGPDCFACLQTDWCGRPWEEVVFYELHVGTFTREGTYNAVIEHLPGRAEIGFTAIELMPIAQFPGRWGWDYDGVFQFASHNAYRPPNDLRGFVDAAHKCGLTVFLDVVYNHFGPEGNFLLHFAPGFFHSEGSHAVGISDCIRRTGGTILLHRKRSSLVAGVSVRWSSARCHRSDC